MQKGINYDTGFSPGPQTTRSVFDPDVVRRDMRAIAEDLHCTAVRISGGDPERLSVAGDYAAAVGLDVWFAPVPTNLPAERMLAVFDVYATRAEGLRERSGNEVVLVLGCEVSVFAEGFVPGVGVYERLANLSNPTPEMYTSYPALLQRLNNFLAESARAARRTFGGRLTYASGLWEQVDWRLFDIVGVDAYRDASNAAVFGDVVRAYVAQGKPVAITEFGCCTYAGAAAVGGAGWALDDQTVVPDEREQVRYLRELWPAFEQAGVEIAFWFTFGAYHLSPGHDAASYGAVSLLDAPAGRSWRPKEVFHALAEL